MSPDLDAEAELYGCRRQPKKNRPDDPITVNFSGYPIPPDSTRTVAELEDYYIHGLTGAAGTAPDDPERAAYLGEPISGDGTARYAHWRRTGNFPTYADIPEVKPEGALF